MNMDIVKRTAEITEDIYNSYGSSSGVLAFHIVELHNKTIEHLKK